MTDEALCNALRYEKWGDAADRIEALTAERDWFEEEWVSAVDRLNKAVEALEAIEVLDTHEMLDFKTYEPCGVHLGTCAIIARDTLAEIEGEKT
jgi:hypothetical protein